MTTIRTEPLITALQSGLATHAELRAHFGCEAADLRKPLGNLVTRKLAERILEGDQPAYRLTAKGRKWKPGVTRHGGDDSEGGETDVTAELPAPAAEPAPVAPVEPVALAAPEDVQRDDADDLADTNPGELELLHVLADIRVAIGDRGHVVPLGELAEHVRQQMDALREVTAERNNARALADKLQHLLDSARHEYDALRDELAAVRGDGPSPYSPCCEPDLETTPLQDLIRHAGLYLEEGQSLTIYPGDHCAINAFGRKFSSALHEANGLLDAAATLARATVIA
jgi:hypothetical protein